MCDFVTIVSIVKYPRTNSKGGVNKVLLTGGLLKCLEGMFVFFPNKKIMSNMGFEPV